MGIMKADFKVTVDNSAAMLDDMETRIQAALEACGQQAVSHAKQNITRASRVDTGAMRNSINHTVKDGKAYIGTNIEYAAYHEVGTGIFAESGKGRKDPWIYKDDQGNWHRTRGIKPIHFLKNAVAENIAEYKAIMAKFISNK